MGVIPSQVSSIGGFIETGYVNKGFTALILLPIVGNAAEIVCRMLHLERSHRSWVPFPGHYRYGLIQESPRPCHERCSELVHSDCPLRHPIFGAAWLDYRTAAEFM